jgi:hypothetical protein
MGVVAGDVGGVHDALDDDEGARGRELAMGVLGRRRRERRWRRRPGWPGRERRLVDSRGGWWRWWWWWRFGRGIGPQLFRGFRGSAASAVSLACPEMSERVARPGRRLTHGMSKRKNARVTTSISHMSHVTSLSKSTARVGRQSRWRCGRACPGAGVASTRP